MGETFALFSTSQPQCKVIIGPCHLHPTNLERCLSSAFQSNQTTFKAEDDQLLPKQPNSISCCQLYSQVIGKYARTYRSRMQTVPEDNISDGEGVLIDASGWHPHTQHVLCCRDKVLSTNSLQVIKVTVAGYQIYQVRKSHYTVARNQYLFL